MKKLGAMLVLALVALGFHQGKADAATVTLADQVTAANDTFTAGGPLQFVLSAASKVTFEWDQLAGPDFTATAVICPSTTLCSSPGVSNVTGLSDLSFSKTLAAGTYYLDALFKGTASTFSVVHWSLTANTSVTPIPPALLMFVTGLGGLGVLGYRRRQNNII